MTGTALRQHYEDYLAVLNTRRFEDLPRYVADRLVYNGATMTGAQYRAEREADVRRIPDLVFEVDLLVVEGDHVAARLRFDCTPREPLNGFLPTGARVVFHENVFYRFEHDRIVDVRSLLDLDALSRQLPRAPAP